VKSVGEGAANPVRTSEQKISRISNVLPEKKKKKRTCVMQDISSRFSR
jgi:hypothetical protein